jgi:hypothetical protein
MASAVLREVLDRVKTRQGFLSTEDLAVVASNDRLAQVLVRCGGCRFTCPAQDAQHLMDIIERDDKDYVRDVTLVAWQG